MRPRVVHDVDGSLTPMQQYKRKWYLAHRDEMLARVREDPARNRAKTKEWKAKNPERFEEIDSRSRAKNALKRRAYAAKRRAEHPDKIAASKAASRHARRERGGQPIPFEVVERVLSARVCYYCGVGVSRRAARYDVCKTTIDHVLPLCRGGTNEEENLVAACLTCNSRKQTMLVDRFLSRLARRIA